LNGDSKVAEIKARDSDNGPTYLYVIAELGDSGPTKIGISQNVNKRLSGLQNGNPRKIALYSKFKIPDRQSAIQLEYLILRKFRTDGASLCGEWVQVSPVLVESEIQKMLDQLGERYSFEPQGSIK
jgi:predicted GIY-YIG superfamily endonuclease